VDGEDDVNDIASNLPAKSKTCSDQSDLKSTCLSQDGQLDINWAEKNLSQKECSYRSN
jgi:hypothetical protein